MTWFDRELRLVDPWYFAMYNPLKRKWEMRRNVFRLKNMAHWSDLDKLAHSTFVRSCKHLEPVAQDLYLLRRGLYNARHAREILRQVDESNRALTIAADAENTYQHRAAAAAIYHHYNEPTVHLSGKEF